MLEVTSSSSASHKKAAAVPKKTKAGGAGGGKSKTPPRLKGALKKPAGHVTAKAKAAKGAIAAKTDVKKTKSKDT